MKKIIFLMAVMLVVAPVYAFDTHNGNNSPTYTEWIPHFTGYTGVQTGPLKQYNIFASQHNWEVKLNGTVTNLNIKLETPGGSGSWYTLDTYSTTSPTSTIRFNNNRPVDRTRVSIYDLTGGGTVDVYTQHGAN